MPDGYAIRGRTEADDQALVNVENRASELFRSHGYPQVADSPIPDVDYLRNFLVGKRCWVAVDAEDQPVGFAAAMRLGGYLHLAELSVDPAHGRMGIGKALVQTIIDEAASSNLAGVSLTTFRTAPFNQPYYERFGFAEARSGDVPTEIEARLAEELPEDVDIRDRALMVLDLDSFAHTR